MLSRENVQRSSRCTNWQALKKDLRKDPTATKLIRLRNYLAKPQDVTVCGCTQRDKWIQAYSYLNSLTKLGMIMAVFTRDLEDDKITILKEK
jgi:hypothetical protein